MQLIDVRHIRDRLLLDDTAEINDALKSAVAGASPRLETILDTVFSKGSAVDYFHLDPSALSFGGIYRLRLSRGFLRPTPTLTVMIGDSLGGTTEPVNALLVDVGRGLVSISEEHLGKYVKVSYDYGFTGYAEVPEWLREVTICYAIKVLSMTQVNDRKDELSSVYDFVDTHSTGILNSHLRSSSRAVVSLGL